MGRKVLKLPGDTKEFLKRKFINKHREWLRADALKAYALGVSISGNDRFSGEGAAVWPLEINLGIPVEREALKQPEKVREWISAWKSWQGRGTLVWCERHWRSLGTQSVPEKLILDGSNDAAIWIDETARWLRAVDRYKSLVERWPVLLNTLPKYYNILAGYDESDFLNLSKVLLWLCDNPDSNLYIRQIPVSGIDSKWLESRKSLVCELLAMIHGDQLGDSDFFKRCGLKPQPQLLRMRLLDKNLRSRFNGISDISAPLEEIAGLDIAPVIAFIVENIQSALAFNDLKNSVVLMGLGYGVDVLGKIPWLRQARCVYWGDIDTHGFAILNRARSYLPHLETTLMDEATLLNHRELWVEEKEQHTSTELPFLTGAELILFQLLKNNTLGQHIRLEQERIRWDEAWNALQKII
jgi:hypothetical protein